MTEMFSNLKTGVEVFLQGLSASELILMTLILTILLLLLLILMIQKWILEDIKKIRIRQTQIIESLNVKLNQIDQPTDDLPYFSNNQTDDLNIGQETQLLTSEIGNSRDIWGTEAEAQADDHLNNDRLSDEVQPIDRLKIDASSDKSHDNIRAVDRTPAIGGEIIRNEILTYLRRTKRPTDYKDILRHITRNMDETDGVSSMNEIVFNAINYMEDQGDLESALVGGKLICKLIDK
jgi:hypothetical protein